MRLNESSKHSFYNSLKENLNEETYYYKRWGKNGAGEIDYREFNDMWDAQDFAEKINKETGDETAVYKMSNDECIALFDEKKDRPSEIVIDSYNHFVNDLGKTPTLDDIEEDILSSYDDAYDYFKGNDSAEEASKDIKYIKSILRKEGLKYNDELEESAKLKEDEEYVIDDEKMKKYAAKYQASDKRSKEMFKGNYDPYSQPQEIIDIINKGIAGCSSWKELMNDYNDNPDSDWYIDIIKAAQRELARRDIDKKEKEEKQKAVDEEKEYNSAKRELDKLRKEHSTRIGRIDYLFNLIKDYESKHGIKESSLKESDKRISHFGEFDNGHVFNKWYNWKDSEAEEKAKQMSIEHPDDIWYVQYDDVMNPSSDKRWFRGKEYDSSKGYEIYRKVLRNGFNIKSPEEQKKILDDLGLNESDENDGGHHTIPYDVQEVVENEVYEDRNLNIRGSQFRGSDFVIESRDEMNEDIFHKIVDRIVYHFNSYGISYDSIEDEGNNIVAYDCYMNDEAYNEYKENSDDYKVEDEDFYMVNDDTDKKVHVYKDGNKWYDSDGNRYMGYLTKDQVKAYFKGNWTESK